MTSSPSQRALRASRRSSRASLAEPAADQNENQKAAAKRPRRLSRRALYCAAAVLVTSVLASRHPLLLEMTQRATPTSPGELCKLHYAHFHLLWTVPQTAALYLVAAPFLTQLDHAKLVLLPIIAFVWTTPWDNELVRQRAWWYPSTCVLGRVGYVPLEEYFFFIIQSVMTSLVAILITRWITPRIIKAGAIASKAADLFPLAPIFVAVFGLASLLQTPHYGHRYYLSMIAWWASIPLILLWGGTRHSWAGTLAKPSHRRLYALALALPTAYLCFSDLYALRRGTWHISEHKSLNIFIAHDLPVEEAIFFLATNLILISACFTFDRVVWQCRTRTIADTPATFAPMSPSCFRLHWQAVPMIWHHFVHLDRQEKNTAERQETQGAIDEAMRILADASKSFHTASTLLPWDLRTDLGCIYAFARAMDDFIDVVAPKKSTRSPKSSGGSSVSATDSPQRRLDMLHDVVDVAFNTEATASQAVVAKKIASVLRRYSDLFADEKEGGRHRHALQTSALAASLLRAIVPVHLWHELLNGYATDSQSGGPHFSTFAEQASYAQDVAGSIGEMCVRIILARSGILVDKGYRTRRDTERAELVARHVETSGSLPELVFSDARADDIDAQTVSIILRDARRMGVALQLVNIARDIADDARELHRCYVVLDESDKQKALCTNLQNGRIATTKEENGVSLSWLFREKQSLLQTSQEIYSASIDAISFIPSRPAQTGLRAACQVYMSIGNAIKRDGEAGAGKRSRATCLERIFVALKAVYSSV